MIMPKRVVFEGQMKTQEMNLANIGKDTARYLVSLMEIRMTNDGAFEQITVPDSGQNFASANVRIFPRSVVLGPGEAQTVKVQVVKQGTLLAGEYRSHIYFRALPNQKPLGQEETARDSTGISVSLKAIFGISIPVIIKVGESTSTVTISDAAFIMLADSTPIMEMVLNRTGNMSTYGDLTINFISTQGRKTQVAVARGLAVYTPTGRRRIRINLNKYAGIDYKTGKLQAVYRTSQEAQALIMAETELVLF
jgi:hypothetical protein